MAYIEVIPHQEAEGELKAIYDELVAKRGKLADVHMIQSLNPPTIVAHMDLYMKIMFGKSPLRRYQREMMAVIVSKNNDCHYCIRHHAEALNHFWKDEEKLESLISDYTLANLTDKDQALCSYAEILTQDPNASEKQKYIENLKKLGCTDRAILDATLVIAYFNFVNRIVLGLGVELEKDAGKGYQYD